ncbi:glucosaminidase domain-containing protein [Candidatus Saccharibacteria bacterium]|nr:glucosaminidase domain-containing protein [Candidatus Saccharibacteria bacterium]
MLDILRNITKRFFYGISIVILLWSFLVIGPPSITSTRSIFAINECDKYAIDKGSIFTDSKLCADPCEDSTTAAPATTPNTPGSVFILGDSIGQGITGPLGTALGAGWSASGNTRVGRPLSEGITEANKGEAGLKSAKYILVILGTNNLGNSTNEADISTLMSTLKAQNSGAKVYWLKANVTRSDLKDKVAPYNQLLQASGANLIDNTVALSADGVHPADYTQLAGSVSQVLKGGTPTTPTQPGSSSAQDLAKQMLSNTNITYWTNNGVNTRDVVVALSEGKKAYTTAANATNKEADINVNILKFIIEVAGSNKIMVNALTDKSHSNGSNHYKGLAVDLDNNGGNSAPTSVLDPVAAKYGGTRNSETTHWHYDFTTSVDTTTTTAPAPAPCCSTGQSSGATTTNSTGAENLQAFVDKYGKMAFETGKKYGIPYEAILGQGSVESANGNSTLTKEAFNFFGIKAGSAWKGPVWTGKTGEENADGSGYTVTAAFRSYPNAQAGFDGYGEFITTNSRYKNALNYPSNPEQYIIELKKAGYATDTAYVNTITRATQQATNYIKSKNMFPPSSEVVFDTAPPSPTGSSGGSGGSDCKTGETTQPTGDGSVESNKQIAKNLLIQKGLSDTEWQCLDKLWTRESGWRQDADNPSSSAYGIPQALPGEKMASAGADWKTNPLTQINWGLGYIEGRYQTPCGAWAHSESVGWY